MPVSWRVTNGLVYLESSEAPTLEEWRAAVEGALASSDYQPGMGVLHDTRLIKRFHSVEEAEERVAFVTKLGIRRWAVLAESPVGYGLGRLGEGLSSGTPTEIRAFRDPAKAEAWARGGPAE